MGQNQIGCTSIKMTILPEKKKEKELTEQQEKVLSVLFGEAQGSPQKAGEIVGYHPNTWPKVVKALKNEIIEQADKRAIKAIRF